LDHLEVTMGLVHIQLHSQVYDQLVQLLGLHHLLLGLHHIHTRNFIPIQQTQKKESLPIRNIKEKTIEEISYPLNKTKSFSSGTILVALTDVPNHNL
jgi:hypothetical protein